MHSKTSLLLASFVLAFASVSAFAESYSAEEVPEAARSVATQAPAPVSGSLRGRVAVELSATMSGSLGGNQYTASSDADANAKTVYVSDSNVGLAVRGYFNENFAVGASYDFGSMVMDGGRNVRSNGTWYAPATQWNLHPVLVNFRYQFASFGGSDSLRPYGEFGFGPTVVSEGIHTNSPTVAYLSARGTLGLDAFLTRANRTYFGVRFGYLAVNHEHLSATQGSADFGYLF